jgi:glycosyltransferase involved in cell wall biosynthesis
MTICLNMIVRNETPVLRRCIDSVRPFIDSWIIVDTGSTDGTQALVHELLGELPGTLFERPWVDFGHNRTEALELARGHGDYLLFIDADEVLECDAGFVLPPLTADVYSFELRYNGCSYLRKQLARNDGTWRYEGILHEYLTSGQPHTDAVLEGVRTVPRHDGARARDPLTYRGDALLLERALLAQPDHPRHVFYLAQSYRDANEPSLALRHYKRRVELGGWSEEVWYSLYQIATLKERMNAPWPEVMEAYLAAYQFCPDRAEPLFRIGIHFQARKEHFTANLFLSQAAASAEPPVHRLFVERPLYAYQIGFEHAVAAACTGDQKTAIETYNELLRVSSLPAAFVDLAIRNRRFSVDANLGPGERPRCNAPFVRVVIVYRDPGPELDDCIESLLQQVCPEWEAVFIDDGSASPHDGRIPTEDARVSRVRHEMSRGAPLRLAEHLGDGDGTGRDVVILPLPASERFAGRESLGHVRNAFTDPECALVYGQFRAAGGALGHAEPASGEEDFRARGSALAAGAPAAFRARLWDGAGETLWPRAGFAQTRFLDATLTIRTETPPAGVPRMRATSPRPLISCLMVTLDRLSLAKRAITCFARQTWENRELVLVTDGNARYREALRRFVDAAGIDRVRFVEPGERLTLGALRNVSLAEARGDIVCQWDDDDCYHFDRLRVQCEELLRQQAGASFLSDHLQWIAAERILCWIDWTLGGAEGAAALFPGSLLMHRDTRFRYPETGGNAHQGEDSALLAQLFESVPVAALAGAGHLYLYEYHGRNTFDRAHHLNLANYRASLAHLQTNAEQLRAAIAHYDIPRPVVIVGREGPAFAL